MNGYPTPLPEDDLSHRLLELCTCDGRFPPCIYCEARDRIDAQDRCLRLAQADLAKVRPLAQALDASLRWSYRDTGDLVRESKPPQFDAAISQSFRMDVLTMRAGWKIAKEIVR